MDFSKVPIFAAITNLNKQNLVRHLFTKKLLSFDQLISFPVAFSKLTVFLKKYFIVNIMRILTSSLALPKTIMLNKLNMSKRERVFGITYDNHLS